MGKSNNPPQPPQYITKVIERDWDETSQRTQIEWRDDTNDRLE